MTERELEKQCHSVLRARLTPMPRLWHINDQITAGQPDTEIVWNGHTTKIEFKKLKAGEDLHKKWEDGRQLITCVQYERASMGRCWVVVYERRKGDPLGDRTIIYRPTKLLDGQIPTPRLVDMSKRFELLWNHGAVCARGGFMNGHLLVADLIRETHK